MNQSDNQNALTLQQNSLVKDDRLLQPAPTIVQSEDEVEISSYFDTLFDNRWLILKVTLIVALLGAAYAFLTKPVYEATMMVNVEEDKPNTSKNILGDISSLFDVKAAATSEMELLKSRLVVSRAVDELGLYIKVKPKYFPLIGSWIARNTHDISNPGLLGLGGYVWGNESMNIHNFYVPNSLQKKDFLVTLEPDNQYRITLKEKNIDLHGTIGTPLHADVDGNGSIDLLIDKISAKPGAQFNLEYVPKLAEIENVQNSMTIAEKGKQSGIIAVTVATHDPQLSYDILNQIGNEYIHQNVTRKLEEAEKSLAFLDKQLPDLKKQLEDSESKYYQFRNSHGTIDLVEEAKLILQQSMAEKNKRLELQQKRQELLVGFTPNHPIVIGIDKQISDMNKEIATMDSHIKELPMLEQDLLKLNRDVKVNSDLYAALLNTAQQLRLVKAGKVSNVRLIDTPMLPTEPASPDRPKIIGISVVVGLFLGVAIAFFRKMLNAGIDDPRKIEQMFSSRVVYATIPHSQVQERFQGKTNIKLKSQPKPMLARMAPGDIAIESLRSFRTALQFSMSHFKNNIVVITGPTRGLGKSFISSNFATIMAASGKRVLLIDADFRDGHLHDYFGVARKDGLSESITGAKTLAKTIHRGVFENLDFLSTGNLPPNPSEFLLHPNFDALLKTVSSEYDFVMIDTPPILAASDTVIIGALVGAVFILARAGVTNESEINESIKRLNQAGISPKGILFNDLKVRAREYGRYSYGNNQIAYAS
ncbi:MAG: polysaccharide biosynthesis tyrosine autokinase [Burkholderiaceae bacterium]